MLTIESFVLVTSAFLFGGFVKGTIGLGLPIVALAVLATPMGLGPAIAVMLLPVFVTNIWQALSGPHLLTLLKRLWGFLTAALVGTWIGVSVLAEKSDFLLGMLGVMLCIYSATYFFGLRAPSPGKNEKYYSPVAGGVGGLLFGLTGNFIVPGILYLQALGMQRNMLVQALGLTFVTISGGLSIAFLFHSFVPREAAILSAYALVPATIGLIIGQRYRHKIAEEKFTKLFFSGLLLTGIYVMTRAFL